MPVAERAQKACFSPIGSYFAFQVALAAFVQFSIRGFAKEFIAKRNLIIDAVVHRSDKFILRGPILVFKVVNIAVVPGNNSFIRRQFLSLPILAQVGGETFVNPADVRQTGRAFLAAYSQPGIELGQYLAVSSRRIVYDVSSLNVLIERRSIQILKAGCGYE